MKNRLFATPNDLALTIARIILGIVFFAHGAQKMLGWFGGSGFSATMQGFTSMGFPSVLAFLVIFIEFFGALALIFGLLARPAALGIVALMLGAIAMVHLRFGFFMNWYGKQPGEGFEFHLLAIALAIVILIRGAGALSVDRAIARTA